MGSPRWRKVLRDIWLHKARTILVVLAIALGIFGAGAVLTTWALMRVTVRDGYAATHPASATLRVDSIDTALLRRVERVPGVGPAQARRVLSGRALVQGTWRPLVLFSMHDFPGMRLGLVTQVTGAWPPRDGQIVIERSALPIAQTAVGDTLAIRVGAEQGGRIVRVGVSGVARDVGLAPGWMEHVVYGFVTPSTIAELGVSSTMDELQFVVRDAGLDREAVRRIAFAVKGAVEETGRVVTDMSVPVPGQHIHAAQMGSLLYTQAAFGVLVLMMSGILVVNLIAAMLAGQVREIGVMKTIGAESRQIAGLYLGLALVLGLVATMVAIPAAAAVGRRYAEFTSGMLNFDMTGVRIPGWVYAVELAVGALLPVLAAGLPVSRGCRIPVADALQDLGMTDTAAGRGRLLAGWGGLSRPFILSLRNAFRRRQRMTLTLLTLSMGGAVFLGALNLQRSIRATMDAIWGSIRYDMVIGFPDGHDPDRVASVISRARGVAGAEAWSGGRAAVARPDGAHGDAFNVSAIPAASPLLTYPLIAGRWLRPGDRDAIVVGARVLDDEPTLAVGNVATLVINGRRSDWTVVGVAGSFLGGAFVTREGWSEVVGDTLVRRAVVVVDTGSPSRWDVQRLMLAELTAEGLPVSAVSMVVEARAATEDHLVQVADFLSIMSWLLIAVGGLGLASTMSLAVMERTREIGVLRAIGARHWAIHAIVQGEGLVIGLLGWLLAIPFSIPMSLILGSAFGRIMFKMPLVFVPSTAGIVEWLVLAVGVTVVACAWPALRATRIRAAAALAYG